MTPAVALANPFPGLAPFAEHDASHFFGRDQEIDDVLDRLAVRRLLAVIGVSGCGKSSLVHAGVIPVLRLGVAQNLPTRLRICTLTPGNAPLENLAAALDASPGCLLVSLDLLHYAKKTLQPGEALLLVVDQFEELFRYRAGTLSKDGGNAASLFVNLLLNAVSQREVPIYIVLTMRTDFLGECAQFRGLPEALNDSYYLVPRMTRLQQQEAIELPLSEQETAIHPALVQRLLNDSAEDPDQLPVLQHLLKRLWENWSERSVVDGKPDEPIGLADYEAVGGWKDALSRDAALIMARFPVEKGIRRFFQWITDRGTGDKPVRRPRAFAECLAAAALNRETFTQIVRAFEERGLLKPWDGKDDSLLDLTHESIMWQWSELSLWIDQQAELATQVRFFLQSARQQVSLAGFPLRSAVALWKAFRYQPLLPDRFLSAGEQAEIDAWFASNQRSEKSKLRWRVGSLLAIFVTILVLAAVAVWISQRQRNESEARELAAWAAVSLSDDPERSLILGLHSWAKQRGMVGGLEQFLHNAVMQSHTRLTLAGHQASVPSVAWSPDARKLATANKDTAKIWEAATGRELLTLRGHQHPVFGVVWSPDGDKLATASEDKTAKVWEASSGREMLTLRGHQNVVASIAWSPDGDKLATASTDQTAKVWEVRTGRELLTLRGHHGSVVGIAWSPHGSKLATAGADLTAKVWEAATGRELLTIRGHRDSVAGIAWSPDGRNLATASYDRTSKVWDAATGQEMQSLGGHQGYVYGIAWSPDGRRLATVSLDTTSKIWEAATGREILSLRGHTDATTGVAWSPDGKRLVTGSFDRTAKVWDADPGGELLRLPELTDELSWSPDGRRLAAVTRGGFARVWDAGTGHELLTFVVDQGRVMSHSWSPDGSKLVTGVSDDTAIVWDAANGRRLLSVRGDPDEFVCVAWSPDGHNLLTGSARNSKVREAVTGRELSSRGKQPAAFGCPPMSPDGSKLAAILDKVVKVWDAGTSREFLTLRGHKARVSSIAWSLDGSKLATGSEDKTAKVWEANTGRELLTLRGHQSFVNSIAWSPDGSKMATASYDKTVKVWGARSGRELLTLRGHQEAVNSVVWSPDGTKLATASADRTVQIHAIDHTLLLRLVRSRITRDLTPDECRRYLNSATCPPLPAVP
jgi:WD40 repeat protein